MTPEHAGAGPADACVPRARERRRGAVLAALPPVAAMRAVAGRAAARALVGALALAAAAAVLAADGAVDEEAVAPDSTVLSAALGWGAWCLWGVWWLVWVLITTVLTYICLPWLLVRRTNFPSRLCCCLLRHQSAPYPAD
jgi:hypothetical protein